MDPDLRDTRGMNASNCSTTVLRIVPFVQAEPSRQPLKLISIIIHLNSVICIIQATSIWLSVVAYITGISRQGDYAIGANLRKAKALSIP